MQDNVTISLVHGDHHELVLTLEDVFGNVLEDRVSFLSDAEAPTIGEVSGVPAFTNEDTLAVAWELEDATSGLTNVSIRQFNATAVEVASPVFLEPGADTDPVQASALLNLSAIPHGEQLTVQVRGVDRAGNENTAWHNTTRDLLAPSLDGFIDGLDEENTFWANTPEHRDPILDTGTQAGDGVSGLDRLRVTLYNQTSNVEEDSWLVDLEGNATAWSNQSFQGYPNATYSLNATARDTAGNENTTTLATAEVQVFPDLSAIVPRAPLQRTAEDLPIRGRSMISTFAGLPLSDLDVNVTPEGAEDPVHAVDYGSTLGNFSAWWDNDDEPEDTYEVVYKAQLHRAITYLFLDIELLDPGTGFPVLADGVDTSAWGYGLLNSTSEKDRWEVTYDGDCSDWFQVNLWGHEGHDTDLYLTPGDPESVGDDPSTYAYASATEEEPESIRVGSPAAGEVFTVLVTHVNATASSYELSYASGCSSGGGGGGGGGDTGDELLEPVREREPKTK